MRIAISIAIASAAAAIGCAPPCHGSGPEADPSLPADFDPDDPCPVAAPVYLPGESEHRVLLNAYFLQEEAARAVRRGESESAVVEEVLSETAALGVTLLRTHGFNDNPRKRGDSAIQPAPRELDEVSLRGLDLVLARAAFYDVQLIVTLGNFWDDYGGARQYVEWASLPGPSTGDARFFTDERVIDHFEWYVTTLLDRVNTVDGMRYGDHPAVRIWELLNEPRGWGLDCSGRQMRAWVDRMGAAVRGRASAHQLISTGEEGLDSSMDGYDTSYWRGRLGVDWMFGQGSSFRESLESPFIDVASVHMYPDAWGWGDRSEEAGQRWMSEHVRIARVLGKPAIVGELGLRSTGGNYPALSDRRAIYRRWLACARETGAAAAGPWMFANDQRPDAWDRYTFKWWNGTAPEDPRNQYADLIVEAARP